MAERLRSLVKAIRSSRAPANVATRIVAIDGPGGAGKSSLARWLAQELAAPIIQTDDLAKETTVGAVSGNGLSHFKVMAKDNPKWRYMEMPYGHNIPWEHPKELAKILLEYG